MGVGGFCALRLGAGEMLTLPCMICCRNKSAQDKEEFSGEFVGGSACRGTSGENPRKSARLSRGRTERFLQRERWTMEAKFEREGIDDE
jgi:hypothetical protein